LEDRPERISVSYLAERETEFAGDSRKKLAVVLAPRDQDDMGFDHSLIL
jgi:hypothetical protein